MASPRKLPEHLENPFDNLVYKVVPRLSEIAHHHCLTPNHVTTISLMGGFLAIYGLKVQKPTVFILGYLIAYVADAADGYMARRYNQVTKFGDYYDHVKDTMVHIVLFVLLFHLAHQKRRYLVPVSILAVLYLSIIHLKLMDEYHVQQHPKSGLSETLDPLRHLIPEFLMTGDVVVGLAATRWFGLGTFAVVMMLGGAWLATPRQQEKGRSRHH
jgi:phosphatidylglycerophosphate synthase